MNWLTLTLICAFSLASADAMTKARLSDYSVRELAFVRMTLAGLMVSPLLLTRQFPELPPVFWGWVAAIVPLEIMAMLLYIRAIRDHPLAMTLPYLAFTPVFVTLTGYLLLGESITVRGFFGILLIVAGAWLLNFNPASMRNWRTWFSPLSAVFRNQGSLFMLGVALLYSLTSVGGKGAMQYLAPELFGPLYFTLVGLLLVPLLGFFKPAALRRIWRKPLQVFVTSGLMGVMLLTHFIALKQVEVAYMIAVKRISLLFGIVYGAIIFREVGLSRHLFAGAIMVLGVIVIAA
ncbi:MAG: DMT family transporter [Gammaproteobacteria bacterium]|nr:DMT family transporter [Gammaproteobacteria bacterium]